MGRGTEVHVLLLSIGMEAQADLCQRERPRALCHYLGNTLLGRGLIAGQEARPDEEMGWRWE
jgi:hypothetical protein